MAELIDKRTEIQPEDTGEEHRATLTVRLPERELRQLQEMAERLGVSVEDLVAMSIRDFLDGPGEDFEGEVGYLLEKNAELYRRLA